MHPVRAAVCESALHVVCDLLDEASEACAEAYARAEAWRPNRGVAAHLLWAYYSAVKRGLVTAEEV